MHPVELGVLSPPARKILKECSDRPLGGRASVTLAFGLLVKSSTSGAAAGRGEAGRLDDVQPGEPRQVWFTDGDVNLEEGLFRHVCEQLQSQVVLFVKRCGGLVQQTL